MFSCRIRNIVTMVQLRFYQCKVFILQLAHRFLNNPIIWNPLVFENVYPWKHLIQSLLVKWQILSHSKTDNITIFCNQMKHFWQLFHGHLSSARTITDKFRICKIGRMKKVFIQHIDIKMNEDMIEASHKSHDFLVAQKRLILTFIINAHVFQKYFLIIVKGL